VVHSVPRDAAVATEAGAMVARWAVGTATPDGRFAAGLPITIRPTLTSVGSLRADRGFPDGFRDPLPIPNSASRSPWRTG